MYAKLNIITITPVASVALVGRKSTFMGQSGSIHAAATWVSSKRCSDTPAQAVMAIPATSVMALKAMRSHSSARACLVYRAEARSSVVYEGGSRLSDRLKPAYGDWETVGCCLVSMLDPYAVA